MSQGVFINNLNTYIGTALYEEFLGEKPEESDWAIYSKYYEKEDSSKPAFIKKMMKTKSKKGLFRKYILEKFDVLIYDLHCGALDDLKQGIAALMKDPLEKEKVVIVISSVLSWANTEFKMIEDKPKKLDDDGNPIDKDDDEDDDKPQDEPIDVDNDPDANLTSEEKELKKIMEKIDLNDEYFNNNINIDEDGNPIEMLDEDGDPMDPEDEDYKKKLKDIKLKIRIEKIKSIKIEKKYKRVGYKESEYEKRIPADCYKEIKEYEDELLKLKFENLSIYILCSGIPYGNAETVFNYHIKSAWLQDPEELPFFNKGDNYIPTIHVKDLAKIVKLVIEKKPEVKYIFSFDCTAQNTSYDIILNISRGIGSGKVKSIPSNESYLKNLNFNTKTDLFIDPEKSSKLNLILTENELNWQGYLGIDVLLKKSKVYDSEEFQWHCKDFNLSIKKIIKEFTTYRQLKPVKIVLNCEDTYVRCVFAEKLAKFYNVPIINVNTIINMLSIQEKELNTYEQHMLLKYINLSKKLEQIKSNGPDETDPLYDEEYLMFDTLKEILNDNICINRGYILEGIPKTIENFNNLYYRRKEIKKEDGEDSVMDVDDNMNEEDEPEENEEMEDNNKDNMDDNNMNDNKSNMGDVDNMDNMDGMDIDDKNVLKNDKMDDPDNDENEEMEKKDEKPIVKEESIFIDKQDEIDEEERLEKLKLEEEAKKKKKKKPKEKKKRIKLKQFKKKFDKKMLPESVITIAFKNKEILLSESTNITNRFNSNNDGNNLIKSRENLSGASSLNTSAIDDDICKNIESETNIKIKNPFWEVENLYQQNDIESLVVVADKNKDEMMETMRIYIERNGRPYNYYNDNEKTILSKRNLMLEKKTEIREKIEKKEQNEIKKKHEENENKFWDQMNKRIAEIKKAKEEIDKNNEKTRKYLLLNVMPILTKGMLEVCKIDPIDPVDFLADYLFDKSTG